MASRTRLGVAWLLVAGGLFVSLPALSLLSLIWAQSRFLGHGYLIPGVALYLAFASRQQIRESFNSGPPPALGPFAVLAASGVQQLAIIGDVVVLAGISIPLLAAAIAYALAGTRMLRAVSTPVLMLAAMAPLPGFIINRLLFDLKLFVTKVSVSILQLMGETVAYQGNQILVPGHTLFVADACTGLTSIVSMLPLGIVTAYFLSHGIWRRVAVVFCVIPLAMAGNILRVVVTSIAVRTRGVEWSQGMLHESFGVTTFILGTLAMVIVARVLR